MPSITVTTPDGRTVTRKVADKKNLEGVNVGDMIDVTYTRAVLLSIARTPYQTTRRPPAPHFNHRGQRRESSTRPNSGGRQPAEDAGDAASLTIPAQIAPKP